MKDEDCVAFLQWALPHLELHWPGFRKVRRQVCRRLKGRMRELGVPGFSDYRDYIADHPEEWGVIDPFCHITISRFLRDRNVFRVLGNVILPEAAQRAAAEGRDVRCWSAGCASGEEVYSLKIAWERLARPRAPDISFSIIGTDIGATVLRRAETGCYERSTLRELPVEWLNECFVRKGESYCVRREFRDNISFQLQDIREVLPVGPFDLILCRNLVLTYFARSLQERTLERIATRLQCRGVLVIGAQETLPAGAVDFRPVLECREIFRWLPVRPECPMDRG